MGRSILVSPYFSDRASLTWSDQVAAAGGLNLQDQRPTLYWQSSSSAPYLVLYFPVLAGTGLGSNDMGSANPLLPIYFVFGYLNAGGLQNSGLGGASRKIRIRRAASEANLTAAPTYDSGSVSVEVGYNAVYARPHILLQVPVNAGSGGYWRVDFDWSGSTDGYVRFSRLIANSAFQPDAGVAPGWEMRFMESVIEVEDMGGGVSTRPRGVRRTLDFGWEPSLLTSDEGRYVQQFMLERGTSRDFFACVDINQGIATNVGANPTLDPMSYMAIGRMKQQVNMKYVLKEYRAMALTVEELGLTDIRR